MFLFIFFPQKELNDSKGLKFALIFKVTLKSENKHYVSGGDEALEGKGKRQQI